MSMRLLVFGLGYSSSVVVERLRPRCSWIGGTTRSAAKADAMRADGIEPFLFDGSRRDAALAEAARSASHVLVSISPAFEDPHVVATGWADQVLHRHDTDLADGGSGKAIVYLSTIGVYGDAGGAWIDEASPCEPDSPRTHARRIAESGWLDLGRESGASVAVLRLSGIYGPGRNTFLNLLDGTARRLVKPGQVFNRIHVEDIAQAVERCFERRASGIFNVTDDEPAPPQDVVAYAAALMGVEPPPEQDFETAALSPMARSFYGSNKRVSNANSKRDLGMVYAYPNYRDALSRMWTEGTWR
jgi:nucleoside-diphosphate-sugar epimerase